jgi:hypothetical protein
MGHHARRQRILLAHCVPGLLRHSQRSHQREGKKLSRCFGNRSLMSSRSGLFDHFAALLGSLLAAMDMEILSATASSLNARGHSPTRPVCHYG